MARTRGSRNADAIAPGDEPRLITGADFGAHSVVPQSGRADIRSFHNKPGRINLKAVAEALMEAGLDPAVEMARILKEKRPVMFRGEHVKNDKGEPLYTSVVDEETQLRTLNELLQYTQPKLKSVEIKGNLTMDLPQDQVDARLTSLLNKAMKPGAKK